MENLPGKDGTQFRITLTKNMLSEFPNTISNDLEIVSKPIRHRYQWYWKILYYLTFGIFFWEYYSYEVKLKDSPGLYNWRIFDKDDDEYEITEFKGPVN